jgi:hypothetical protein
LFLRLSSKQLPILQTDVNRSTVISVSLEHNNFYDLPIFHYSNKIDCAVRIFKVIVESADIYYGIRSGQLSEALTDKIVKKILTDYSKLSISDIEYAYERFRKEKNDWRNITFDELMIPIQQYHKIKFAVSREKKLMEKELQEKKERDQKEIEFIKTSIELYKNSLDHDYYLGDVFHSRKIYGRFLSMINEDTLSDFQMDANRQSAKLNDDNAFSVLSYTPERIYAKMVVDHAVKNKFKID